MLSPERPPIYIVGWPGRIGGASTKIAHLIRLLHQRFDLTVALPQKQFIGDCEVRSLTEPFGVRLIFWKSIAKHSEAVALVICDKEFFTTSRARFLKEQGLKVVWSNEMMFPFNGEEAAAKEGIVDRVLFVSDFQARIFRHIYQGVPSLITGNYIDPDDYAWKNRRNFAFTIGRLSRADVHKYPLDFPVFYQELGLRDVRYRVMAWNSELQKQYRWHRFGPEWDLLPANKEPALKFLYGLDLFVYPLGHRIKESWGRAVVEAMLTGCVPLVPTGHQFDKLMVNGESGFICDKFSDWKAAVHELYENYPLRQKMARAASDYAREHLCNPEEHRKRWIEALTF